MRSSVPERNVGFLTQPTAMSEIRREAGVHGSVCVVCSGSILRLAKFQTGHRFEQGLGCVSPVVFSASGTRAPRILAEFAKR